MTDSEEKVERGSAEAREHLIKIWSKYEDVAMHFNDLLMRLRTQALGAVAGLVAVAAFFMEGGIPQESDPLPWRSLYVGSLALLSGWVVLFLLDTFYYSRLLLGAVDALLDFEKTKASGLITLSTKIDDRFLRISRRRRHGEAKAAFNLSVVVLFYLPVACFLAYFTWFAAHHASQPIRT